MCAAAATLQASITVLAQPCLLVHIPRSRLPKLSHHVTKHLLAQRAAFLNITSNEIEVSIFASESALVELVQVARRDARRAKRTKKAFDPVQVSPERWHVLFVESQEEHADNPGARVRQISTPLARAGISIMYHSSYMSDYILVQSERLNEAVTLLGNAGFGFYNTNPAHLTSYMSSPPSCSSPGTPAEHSPNMRGSFIFETDPLEELLESARIFAALKAGKTDAATRSRSASYSTSPPTNLEAVSTRISALSLSSPCHDSPAAEPVSSIRRSSPSPSRYTPLTPPVTLLTSDLAMIGLNEESAGIWTSKLIKLLVYPELIQKALPPSPLDDEYIDSKSLFDGSAIMESLSLLDPPCVSLNDDSSDYSSSSDRAAEEGSDDEGAFVDAPLSPIPDSPYELSGLRGYPFTTTTKTCPFFGLTRTSDGTSLTADVHQLATLFPKEERFMLRCADELDWVELDTRDESEEGRTTAAHVTEDAYENPSILKCLQIDLRVFGLDKHGLVARFSEVLSSNGINHQYSSAFKTANLLVSHTDAERALSMLGGY